MTTLEKALTTFKQQEQKINHFSDILSLVHWDQATKAPKKGSETMADAIGSLSSEIFALIISNEMEEALRVLSEPKTYEGLDEVTKACVRVRKRSFDRFKKIPPEMYNAFVILTTNAQNIWAEAKRKNDYSLFEPTLQKIIEMNRKFTQLYGYKDHPYDALLDAFEPGYTVEILDTIFSEVRKETIALLEKINNAPNKPRNDIFARAFDYGKQKEFCLSLLPLLCFDTEAGRLDESAHPFETAINGRDVRITTRYEDDPRSTIFSVIHETGHALYEQGVNPAFEGLNIRGGASMGIHESQSRFLENFVGRSRPFWTFMYPKLQNVFPQQLEDVSLDEFYRAINVVKPSLIRTEADELTYNLHIMIRYEIEKELMAGTLEGKDLPRVWNEKMKEYLGVVPTTDAESALQDIHWAGGDFGYFPTYSLGNLFAAQLYYTIKEQMPGFNEKLSRGEISNIRGWLKQNIHQYGMLYTPSELIVKATGEELQAKYLVKYFNEKYSDIYQL